MKLILIKVLIFSFLLLGCTQSKELKKADFIYPKETRFPEDWLGYWEGDLEIYNADGLAQMIPMALDHQKTDTPGWYKWAIIYGEDTIKGRRDYYLKEIDAVKGFYEVDEKNGIFLRSFLLDKKLVCTFDVSGTMITTIYTLDKGLMYFEILASNLNDNKVSGDTIVNGEEIPKVNSYLSTAYQKGVLIKKTLSN